MPPPKSSTYTRCPYCESGIAGLPHHEKTDEDGNLLFTSTFRCGTTVVLGKPDTKDPEQWTYTDQCRSIRNVNLDTQNKSLRAQVRMKHTCAGCQTEHHQLHLCTTCAGNLKDDREALYKGLVSLAVKYVMEGYEPLPPGRVKAIHGDTARKEIVELVYHYVPAEENLARTNRHAELDCILTDYWNRLR